MSAAELCLLPLHELAERLQRRQISSLELTDAYLARIERLEPQLHAFITLTPERARRAARQADEALQRGGHTGPLAGIPIALKDLFDTAGIRTTANSPVNDHNIPAEDADAVSRLNAAGTVLLGKLHMNEYAFGNPRPDDDVPYARNPWDLARIPWGSSSGAGVALAAGLCAGALGSDTAGSIRGPAAHCGIVGLKPTYDLVSRKGVAVLAWTLDHVGPMARRVRDVAMLLEAILDEASPGAYSDRLHIWPRGLRVGIPGRWIAAKQGLEPDVLMAFDEAIGVLEGLGAETQDIELPAVEHLTGMLQTIILSEAAAYQAPRLRAGGGGLRRGFYERIMSGLFYSAVDYIQAQRGRAMLCREFAALMTTVDIIATPTVATTSPLLEERMADVAPPSAEYTGLFNMTGQPSISIPCGFDRRGLPIGLMLSAAPYQEEKLLQVAAAYEAATDWHRRLPPIAA